VQLARAALGVGEEVHESPHPGGDEVAGAVVTWKGRAYDGGVLHGDATARRAEDGFHLSVHRPTEFDEVCEASPLDVLEERSELGVIDDALAVSGRHA
jgi:hypothetical protein